MYTYTIAIDLDVEILIGSYRVSEATEVIFIQAHYQVLQVILCRTKFVGIGMAQRNRTSCLVIIIDNKTVAQIAHISSYH